MKIGDKVAFVDMNLPRHPLVNYPELNEIVTIDYIREREGIVFILIKEYPDNKSKFGFNGIRPECFRPLDFAERILENILEEINENIHTPHST